MSLITEIENYLQQFRPKHGSKPIKVLDQEFEDKGNGSSNTRFCKPWCKLSHQDRINRLMQYHQGLVEIYGLSKAMSADLQQLFYTHVNDLLDNDEVVIYDVNTARIASINGLKRDQQDMFYLDTKAQSRPKGYKLHVKVHHLDKFPKEPITDTVKPEIKVNNTSTSTSTSTPRKISIKKKVNPITVKKN